MTAALAVVADDPPLPTLEQIATLTPIRDPDGRPVAEVCADLNRALRDAGLLFEEYEFSDQTRHDPDPQARVFGPYRWILCSTVTGGSEGIYIHLRLISQSRAGETSRLVALGKSYGRANALAIAAATQRLLGT